LTGIKWTGKMAKWTGELAKLAKIVKDSKLARRIVSKVDSAKGRIKSLLEDINRRIPKKLGTVLSRTEALENLRRLESKYGEYILKGLGLSSPEGREAILRVLPNLTNDQLENFVRKAQHFLSEKGKTHLGKVLGWSLEEVEDLGFKGKVLEKIIQDFGRKSLDNLNELLKNFPVVDAISNSSGRHIFSIARGTPEYLYDKIRVLFNVKITMAGVESAKLKKFDTMLSLLQKNDKIKDLSDYMNRARLLIPDHAVLPFKAMIVKRVKDPIWRQRMLNAIVSGF
jgi:hypothetical protein